MSNAIPTQTNFEIWTSELSVLARVVSLFVSWPTSRQLANSCHVCKFGGWQKTKPARCLRSPIWVTYIQCQHGHGSSNIVVSTFDVIMFPIQYVKGARPGKAVKRPSMSVEMASEKRKMINEEYENKRTRIFQSHQQMDCPWLKYSDNDGMMWCDACKDFFDVADLKNEQKAWINGTSNFKCDTIKSHESSKLHIKAAMAKWAQTTSGLKRTEVGKAVMQLKMKELTMVQNRFRNAHAVVKHGLSFRTYRMICQLDAAKGYELSGDYMSDKACKSFLLAVAHVEVSNWWTEDAMIRLLRQNDVIIASRVPRVFTLNTVLTIKLAYICWRWEALSLLRAWCFGTKASAATMLYKDWYYQIIHCAILRVKNFIGLSSKFQLDFSGMGFSAKCSLWKLHI